MILTEEQRAAIHAVSGLLTAIGCPQCHSYLQKNYTHHIEVLRAMTDSSEHFSDATEMIGFDLEKVREAVHTLENFAFASGKITAGQIQDVLWGARLLAASAAEIERLQAGAIKGNQFVNELMANCNSLRERAWTAGARIKSLKKEIRRLKHESKVEVKFTNSYIKRLHDAEARIEELESSLDEAEALTKKNAELMNAYLARIAELEDALVEGLTNFLHYRASCYDPARRCPYAKECDDCSTWDACGHVEKFRSEARQLLQAEGKIGPDAKPRVWQIAEERKAALGVILARIEYDQSLPGRFNYTVSRAKDTLRAMLEEARP